METNWKRLALAAVLGAGLCAVSARGASVTNTGSGSWHAGTTWTDGNVPGLADDVTITNGGTVTIATNAANSVRSLTIKAGGVLTHLANSTTDLGERYKVVLTVVDDLTVEAGGRIDADSRGYSVGNGPGKASSGSAAGSHGGKGGYYSSGVAGPTYGSVVAPTNCGSGGSESHAGGGAVQLVVGGTSTINGTVSANGGGGSTYYAGAGGSVFLTTAVLTGSGTLRANGGAPSHSISGGGGRIAVILTNSMEFGDVKLHAYAGSSPNNQVGAGGTVYLEHTNHHAGQGKLIVDYGSQAPSDPVWTVTLQNGLGASSNAFSEIVLTNGGVYALDANDVLNISGTAIRGSPANGNDGLYLNGGSLAGLPPSFSFTNYFIAIGATSASFNPAAALTVGDKAALKIDAPFTLNCPVVIEAGGLMSHSGNGAVGWGRGSAEYFMLNLTVNGSLNIRTNGAVNVDGLGFSANAGPGQAGGNGDGAGSHGGRGNYWTATGGRPGMTYGSLVAPTNCGSGGKTYPGGGVVRLNVTGGLTVNGLISANGGGGDSSYYSGAGGSVFLTTASLAGAGTVRANGGNTALSLTGGGGRLAVNLTNSTDFGSVSFQAVAGTAPNGYQGAAGTVYTETKDQKAGRGTLIVNANNFPSGDAAVNTLVWTNVKDAAVGTVIITNAAILAVSNGVLAVYGNWENKAAFTGLTNGTVEFAGTNTAAIQGHNTFFNLVCTNAGKMLLFEDEKTNTVNGTLTLANATLDSASGNASWYLKAAANTHSVSNVAVGRSDARPGAAIEAYDSTDLGGNYKWVFTASGAALNTWTGATDTDWSKSGNWSLNRSTILTDDVLIPGSCPNYPLLDFEKRIRSLTIASGASMGLNGYNLTVDGNTAVTGTLTAVGAAVLTLGGDVDFSGGGTFNAAGSTVLLSGTNAQSVVSAGNAFYQLTIDKSAGQVIFADAVIASHVVNCATPIAFEGSLAVSSSFQTRGTNVTFCGGVTVPVFYNANGALVFSQAVSTVTFSNWQGDLTFHNDFSSREFYSAPGGMTHTFNAGSTYTIGTLEVYGHGGWPILMRSSANDSAWKLNVTNRADVRQADVRDSNASEGQSIRAVASTDSGNNPNWIFGGPWQTWVGAVSTSFTNENNWIPAGLPGESGHLLIDGYGAYAPIMSGVATVAQVIVGSVTTATLTVDGRLAVREDVEILPRGTITHTANGSTELNTLSLSVGSNLTVHGAINVDSRGFSAGNGPGRPSGSAAGSHGGLGSYWVPGNGIPGPTYGSVTSPTNCGSGGNEGHAGGGAIRLNVAGVTTINGFISANGGGSGSYYGGAGGSVFLTTASLAGNGTIRANGGSTANYLNGSGGRVAVILTNSTTFGGIRIQAQAGTSQLSQGWNSACGTLYLETITQGSGRGTLLVDAANRLSQDATITTLIGTAMTDTTVGTVIITNGAILAGSNRVLTVQGNWENSATFTALTNSTVVFAGTDAATIGANNTFFNLACTNTGKILSFEAGKTNTVNGLLKLGMPGIEPLVVLQSTVEGNSWFLNLSDGGVQEIGKVSVRDSNAGGGQTLIAGRGSVYGGNTVNWLFPKTGGTVIMLQ